jgi:hypothetical protein
MKRLYIASVLLSFLLSGFSYAQEKGPQMSFEKTTHDFGTIKEEDGTVSCKFEFTNTGTAPVIIKKVHASCGCTSPTWSKEPVLPGATGYIKAAYDPKNRPGKFDKSITVIANTEKGIIKLNIIGDVIPKLKKIEDVYPKKMGSIRTKTDHIAFGNIYHDQQKKKDLEFVNISDNDVTLTFKNVPDHIQLRSVPSVVKPQKKGIIETVFDADKMNDWGFIIARVNMVENNGPQINRLSISASIQENFSGLNEQERKNAPGIAFDNTEYDFGVIPQNTTIEHHFTFKNTGQSKLIIRKIKASCGCTVVKPEKDIIKPGETSSLKAVFKSGRRKGRQHKTITVISNDPNNSMIRLLLRGTVSTG